MLSDASAADQRQKQKMEKAEIHPSWAYAVVFEQKVEGFSNETIENTKIYWNSLQKPVAEYPVAESPISKQHVYKHHVFKQPVNEFDLFEYYLNRCAQCFDKVAKAKLKTKQ